MATTGTAITFGQTSDDPAVICAWCGATINEGAPGRISHGMCRDCRDFVLVQSGLAREDEASRVYAVMGRPADALEQRKGWHSDAVRAVMDSIVQRAKTRVETECELAWLAYEEGLDEVLSETREPVATELPLAGA